MMVDRTMEEFDRLDVLVNNVALAKGADRVPIIELDDYVFHRVLEVKTLGTYLCTKAVLKVLIDQGEGGKIVNIASGAGKQGFVNMLAYVAANFAVVGMTQSMAKELGQYKVNVNCVCPGAVDTSRIDNFGRGKGWQEIIDGIPIGRSGTDDEVGEFIAYLCTNAASWIHGQSINMDGGVTMAH